MAQYKKKRRTREHVIADLSFNHVEFFALKAGFSLEKFDADYGYDAELYTYNNNGEIENDVVYIQLKATDNIEKYHLKSGGFSFPIDKQDIELWLNQTMPVILILFDAQKDKAYWLYLQFYFEQRGLSLNSIKTKSFFVHFNEENIVDYDAIRKWRDYKNDLVLQFKGVIKHHV
jgi:hypothetical protein